MLRVSVALTEELVKELDEIAQRHLFSRDRIASILLERAIKNDQRKEKRRLQKLTKSK